MNMRKITGIGLLSMVAVAAQANIVNGDFSSGNVGFSSDYGYITPGPGALYPESLYTVDTNPSASHGSFANIGDHTPGTGNMMIINGAGDTSKKVWFQTVAVTAFTSYTFSYWGTSVYPTAPADLATSVDGVDVNTNTFDGSSNWTKYTSTFTTGNVTSIVLALRNNNGAANGNDFALDDLNLEAAPVPEPASMAVIAFGLAGVAARRRRKSA